MTVNGVVPASGISTMVMLAVPPCGTLPTGQVILANTGEGQVPPGAELPDEKVKPEGGSEPRKITLLAGSGPVFVKTKVKVTRLPTVAGFGFTKGGNSVSGKPLFDSPIAMKAA